MKAILFAAVVSVPLIGCGGGGSGGGGDDDAPADANDGIPDGYERLLGRSWTVGAGGADEYKCVRVTVPEDIYVTSIIAEAPIGTHHTVLSIADDANGTKGPDGEQDCNVSALGTQMLYASGVGTSPLDFPEGVGLKLAAGTQVHLNLHLFNATDAEIEGTSGILIKGSATPPPTLAEMVFAGRFPFIIPANEPDEPDNIEEISGGCTLDQDYTVFALWPHMHQIAVQQRVDITRGANTTTVLDTSYQFAEQKYFLQTPLLELQAGDRVDVTCGYKNNTGVPVPWGDSSLSEMCFNGMYRYPATGSNLFACTDQGAP